MEIKNQILNYFVVPAPSGQEPSVFLSPVTMNSKVAKELLNKAFKNKVPSGTTLFHVCFDLDSKNLYLPNAQSFLQRQSIELVQFAKKAILKDFGVDTFNLIIFGSPFSSIRMRKVSSFDYAKHSVVSHFGAKNFEDLQVVEANLARMPKTTKSLPCYYHKHNNFVGGYIGKDTTFIEELDIYGKPNKKEANLITVPAPFILIDISPTVNPVSTEKEWAVLSGYREYLALSRKDLDEVQGFSDLYAAKQHLYLGWPFEEVCRLFMERVKTFWELVNGIQFLLKATESMEKDGYKSPSRHSYFYTFRVDLKNFPLKIDDIINAGMFGDITPINSQVFGFKINTYDMKSGYITIQTPVYIPTDICMSVLKAKSRPFICIYNDTMKTIDVKSQAGLLKELQMQTKQIEKIKKLVLAEAAVTTSEFRSDERSRDVSLSSQTVHLRNISDYYYACDHIKAMCKKRNMPFEDIVVLVGPLSKIFGSGTKGGFMAKKHFEKSKMKIPHQITKGIWVSPPLIAVDSESMPSYAKQTETLIHEYSHNLFNKQNPEYESLYHKDRQLKQKNPLKWWDLYFQDKDEQLAHKEEIKYELKAGTSVDEIIRDKVGGEINLSNAKLNYPIALKFKRIVQEAIKEIQEEA